MTGVPSPREKPLVLVVDDDSSVVILAHQALEPAGFVVEGLGDGAEALAAFEQLLPDVILLDIVMPEMDGFATCAAIRKLPDGARTPVLMMTGLDDVESIDRSYEVGATDFISKPINWNILGHRVRYMLRASQMQQALTEQAIRDTLTGLYNRRYFMKRMEEEIARADRYEQSLTLLLCDIDNFKLVNDTEGHEAGDQILLAVAKSIQKSTRGIDLVFRWGGDEFVIVLSNCDQEGALVVAERIRQGMRDVRRKTNQCLDLSVGIALYREHGMSTEELIRNADRAMYIAKGGGEKIHVGAAEYHLDENSVRVVFQPIVDKQADRIVGYEALARDPAGRLSVPEFFKKYSSIGKLTELKRICFRSQLKAAQELKLKRVFINIDFDVLDSMERLPRPHGIEVILEISESEALRNVETFLKVADDWRKIGYKFAIDDFGAGFISLPFIARLVPEFIKLDRITMLQATSSQRFKIFLRDMAIALLNYSKEGLIAEGIETEKELKVMRDIGVHLVQGFLFGKPKEMR